MADKNLNALFVYTLKDVYFAENAIRKALPKMSEAASSEALKEAFDTHASETEGQIRRLEQIFELLDQKPEAIPCEAIQGLIKEGDEVRDEFAGGEALDAGLIAAGQAIEHYEIARYGTLRAWALQLGLDEAAQLIEETLAEEESTDELLSELAEEAINPAAV
jgi:ferritin-like metal-binding protein YciE